MSTTLLEYLTGFDLVRSGFGERPAPEGFKYGSYEGMVAAEGRAWTATIDLPEGIERGEKKMCFANAYRLACRREDLTYVEGWAISIIPIHHAWCVDEDGNVIDPTWDFEEGREYFGIEFDIDYVRKVLMNSKTFGLFYKAETLDLLKNSS